MNSSSKLTPKEKEVYMQLTYGEIVPENTNTEAVICRLRAKLGSDFVETRLGEGYIIGKNQTTFIDPVTWKIFRNKES